MPGGADALLVRKNGPASQEAQAGMETPFIIDEPLLDEAFKQAMRRLATTVTIITTRGADSLPLGMTATAVTSLSAAPPSLLACVNRSTSIHAHLATGTDFCVNLLSKQHHELSSAFGGKVAPAERFGLGGWDLQHLPYLKDAQVNFACTVDGLFEYGTHTIVIGRIHGIRMPGRFAPLLYGDGRFLSTGSQG